MCASPTSTYPFSSLIHFTWSMSWTVLSRLGEPIQLPVHAFALDSLYKCSKVVALAIAIASSLLLHGAISSYSSSYPPCLSFPLTPCKQFSWLPLFLGPLHYSTNPLYSNLGYSSRRLTPLVTSLMQSAVLAHILSTSLATPPSPNSHHLLFFWDLVLVRPLHLIIGWSYAIMQPSLLLLPLDI